MYGLYLNNCSSKVFNRCHSWSSEACFCRYFWNLLTLDPCLSMSFTVSCIVCGVMFISSMGTESLLGGGVGLVLVLSNEGSVLVEIFEVTGPISEENLASRFCNLLDTKSLILKISLLITEDPNHRLKAPYMGAYPIDSPQDISYYWA